MRGSDTRKLIVVIAIVSAAFVASPARAAPRDAEIDRGVVQSVSSGNIVLRELDGSSLTLDVAPTTRVLVNALPAAIGDVRPGFVAAVTHTGSAARLIRAFGQVQLLVHAGIVVSFADRLLAIRAPDGTRLEFIVDPRTRIRWRGAPATKAALRAGRWVQVTHTAGGAARRIAVRARRG